MKILYHHRTLADGAEGVHIRAIARAFRELGHDVRMLGFSEAPTKVTRRATVEAIRSKVPNALFECGATAFDQWERWTVAREIRRFRPDLLYKRHSKFDTGALLAARASGIPSVLEVNSLFTSPRYAAFEPLAFEATARRLERLALELATLVVAVSSPLGADIRDSADANVIVVPNGVDTEHFDVKHADGDRIRRRYALSGTVIGWMGIIRDWHGVERLLEVVAAVPEVTALIIGDGPGRVALEEKAAQLGVGRRMLVTGKVTHEEIRDYLAAVDIAVVTDERTGVASPMKLLEYMAMARAVVAPCQANILDLVDPETDGLLFDPEQREAFVETVKRFVRSPELRHTLGAAARNKVEQQRTWCSVASNILTAVRADPARPGLGLSAI